MRHEMSDKKDPSKSPNQTGGPVVKTGPTYGQNRSRNNDGTWHKKRSDAGEPKKKSGCFITTAVCQHKRLSDDCRELQVLRNFRDDYLSASIEGRKMVYNYYSVAPAIADRLVEADDLEHVWTTIQNCVRAIEDRRFEEALAEYRAMVLSLEQKLVDQVA